MSVSVAGEACDRLELVGNESTGERTSAEVCVGTRKTSCNEKATKKKKSGCRMMSISDDAPTAVCEEETNAHRI